MVQLLDDEEAVSASFYLWLLTTQPQVDDQTPAPAPAPKQYRLPGAPRRAPRLIPDDPEDASSPSANDSAVPSTTTTFRPAPVVAPSPAPVVPTVSRHKGAIYKQESMVVTQPDEECPICFEEFPDPFAIFPFYTISCHSLFSCASQ